jgi:hypothetical protein
MENLLVHEHCAPWPRLNQQPHAALALQEERLGIPLASPFGIGIPGMREAMGGHEAEVRVAVNVNVKVRVAVNVNVKVRVAHHQSVASRGIPRQPEALSNPQHSSYGR